MGMAGSQAKLSIGSRWLDVLPTVHRPSSVSSLFYWEGVRRDVRAFSRFGTTQFLELLHLLIINQADVVEVFHYTVDGPKDFVHQLPPKTLRIVPTTFCLSARCETCCANRIARLARLAEIKAQIG